MAFSGYCAMLSPMMDSDHRAGGQSWPPPSLAAAIALETTPAHPAPCPAKIRGFKVIQGYSRLKFFPPPGPHFASNPGAVTMTMTTTKQYDYLNRLTFTGSFPGSAPAPGAGNGAPPLPSSATPTTRPTSARRSPLRTTAIGPINMTNWGRSFPARKKGVSPRNLVFHV